MSDVDPTDPAEGLDKRRNRVTDPDLQNSFLGGVNEGRPGEDAIGKPSDEPTYELTATAADGSEQVTTTTKVSEVLAMVENALVNGKDITVKHVVKDEIIDADVID